MDYQTLEGFRRKLLGRRSSLLERRQHALAQEEALLAEREPDWEDEAAARSAATVLEGLGEAERRALMRVQSALARIECGTYDECIRCRGAISEERLRAVPDTELCERCAAAMT
jgi:RNA polymerase-binding transcription factor DksA